MDVTENFDASRAASTVTARRPPSPAEDQRLDHEGAGEYGKALRKSIDDSRRSKPEADKPSRDEPRRPESQQATDSDRTSRAESTRNEPASRAADQPLERPAEQSPETAENPAESKVVGALAVAVEATKDVDPKGLALGLEILDAGPSEGSAPAALRLFENFGAELDEAGQNGAGSNDERAGIGAANPDLNGERFVDVVPRAPQSLVVPETTGQESSTETTAHGEAGEHRPVDEKHPALQPHSQETGDEAAEGEFAPERLVSLSENETSRTESYGDTAERSSNVTDESNNGSTSDTVGRDSSTSTDTPVASHASEPSPSSEEKADARSQRAEVAAVERTSPHQPAPDSGRTSDTSPRENTTNGPNSGQNGQISASLDTPRGDAASGTARTDTAETAARAENAQRVADAIRTAATTGPQRFRIRLHPPELGSLQVEIVSRENSGIVARLQVGNAAAQRALVDQLPALNEHLAARGHTVERIDVLVGDGDDRLRDARGPKADRGPESRDEPNRREQRQPRDDGRRDRERQRRSENTGEPDDSHVSSPE